MIKDQLDKNIIAALQLDGRASHRQIAQSLGVSTSTIVERVKRLEQKGIITGYTCTVDLTKMGAPLQVLVSIQLQSHSRDSMVGFLANLESLPEVAVCFHTGGEYDVVAHVALSDSHELREWIFDHLTDHPDVKTVQTSVLFV